MRQQRYGGNTHNDNDCRSDSSNKGIKEFSSSSGSENRAYRQDSRAHRQE